MHRTFWRDRRGATAVTLSLALIPLLATFSLAVNYSDAVNRRNAYQAIADAAALAGATAAKTEADEARRQRAQGWFEAQVAAQKLPPARVAVSVKSGIVEVEASATIKPLVDMINLGAQVVSVRATAAISQETIRRVLDVAMCIDATGSMQNTINSVKARAQNFSDDLNNALAMRGLEKFDHTRIRVVFYRDFAVDNGRRTYYRGYGWYQNPVAMEKSDFFEMPAKKNQLQTFIGSVSAAGGGDLPESGYECINEGMISKWFAKGAPIPGSPYKADEIYPVIVLWSDADALPVPHPPSIASGQYPLDMPQTETLFRNKWNNPDVIDQKNRLLVHFGLCNAGSWALGRSLGGYMCGGTLSEGNSNMINKIADVMANRYRNTMTRLTK